MCEARLWDQGGQDVPLSSYPVTRWYILLLVGGWERQRKKLKWGIVFTHHLSAFSDLPIFQWDGASVTKPSTTMTPVLSKLPTCDDHALSPDTMNGLHFLEIVFTPFPHISHWHWRIGRSRSVTTSTLHCCRLVFDEKIMLMSDLVLLKLREWDDEVKLTWSSFRMEELEFFGYTDTTPTDSPVSEGNSVHTFDAYLVLASH